MIIAGFAGIGKTTFCTNNSVAIDFECMPFKYRFDDNTPYEKESVKANPDLDFNPMWQYEYANKIEELCVENKYKYIAIPTDFLTLYLLTDKGLNYNIVYPKRSLKDEYKKRYIARGNTEHFLDIFVNGWDNFINSLEKFKTGNHIVLNKNEFLSDVIDSLI